MQDMQRIMIMGFSYALSSFMDCTIAASRGLGKTIVPTIVVIIGSCVFRVGVGIYNICIFPHNTFIVPAIPMLMDNNSSRRDSLLYTLFQETGI